MAGEGQESVVEGGLVDLQTSGDDVVRGEQRHDREQHPFVAGDDELAADAGDARDLRQPADPVLVERRRGGEAHLLLEPGAVDEARVTSEGKGWARGGFVADSTLEKAVGAAGGASLKFDLLQNFKISRTIYEHFVIVLIEQMCAIEPLGGMQ